MKYIQGYSRIFKDIQGYSRILKLFVVINIPRDVHIAIVDEQDIHFKDMPRISPEFRIIICMHWDRIFKFWSSGSISML